jgi:tetratricopeptide (TPR) repeat protein
VERRQLLVHTLKLWREQGNDFQVAETLMFLADANRLLGLHTEGIQQAKESLGILEQLDHTSEQADALRFLAYLLCEVNQLDAAEEAASQSINLILDQGKQFRVCQGYDALGNIFRSKGETEKAINHFKTALGIASPFNWLCQKFWILYSLAGLFFDEGRFDDAHNHIKYAQSHAVNDPYPLGCAVEL